MTPFLEFTTDHPPIESADKKAIAVNPRRLAPSLWPDLIYDRDNLLTSSFLLALDEAVWGPVFWIDKDDVFWIAAGRVHR
jgi:hypothetical protein